MASVYQSFIAVTHRITTRVGHALEWFFYQRDAFKFKGIMKFALQLITVLGVGISLQFLAAPATVLVENKEPIGCFDLALFEESYSLQKHALPQQLKNSILKVALRDWPKGEYQVSAGPVARGLPLINPNDISHQILCWYGTPRSKERLEEVHRLELSLKNSLQKEPSISKIDWIEHEKRMAQAEEYPIDTSVKRQFSAASFLMGLNEFSTPEIPLNLAVLFKPHNPKSRYQNTEAWKEDVRIAEISDVSDILKVIEASGLKEEDILHAYEQFNQVRFFLNWVEVSTTSAHAVSSKVNVTISRWGPSEQLGGNLHLIQEQSYFTGSIEKLLPRERFWALIKTSRPIRGSDISVIADPTPFFDPHRMWKLFPILILVVLAWTLGNILPRIR